MNSPRFLGRTPEDWLAAFIVFVVAMALALVFTPKAHADEINVPWLVQTIIMAESSGDPAAIGDNGKARGLGQLTRATWSMYTSDPWSKAFDPALNRDITTLRVMHIISKFDATDPAYVAYRYNCGDYTKLSFYEWKRRQPNRTYRTLYA